jgi:hypothetical protein
LAAASAGKRLAQVQQLLKSGVLAVRQAKLPAVALASQAIPEDMLEKQSVLQLAHTCAVPLVLVVVQAMLIVSVVAATQAYYVGMCPVVVMVVCVPRVDAAA